MTGRLTPGLTHGTEVTFTSSLTYTKSSTQTFWAGDMGRAVVDEVRPTSAILAPTEGDILRGQAYVVGGSATDRDGRVQKVEVGVSRDEGATWTTHTAEGQAAWNWTWSLPADGNYTLRSRATDEAGWPEDPVTRTVNVAVDNTPPRTTLQVTHPGGEILDGRTVRLEPTAGAGVITATGQVRDNVSGAPRVAGVDTLSLQRDGRDQPVTMAPPSPGQPVSDWQAVMRLPSGRPEGEHRLVAWAPDQIGNVHSPMTLTFRVDNTPPVAGAVGAPLVITPSSRMDLLHLTADELGRYQPLPQGQFLGGGLDARGGGALYRALSPADLTAGRLASGDFNGDDIPDLAVGAPGYQGKAGAVYLIFGKAGPWLPRHNLNEADAWLMGPATDARLGLSLANAGDLNGDGADDLLIGSADGAYVVFGKDSGWRRGQALDAARRLLPGQPTLVAGGGDLNGDGRNDGVVAVKNTVYLVTGGPGGIRLGARLGTLPGTINSLAGAPGAGVMAGSTAASQAWLWQPVSTATSLPRAPSAKITATPGWDTPIAVGYAGDVNQDGRPDWLLGDGHRSPSTLVGALFLGRDWGGQTYDYLAAATTLFSKSGSLGSGTVATGLGDVNGDGYADFLLGDGSTGWVMYGQTAWPRNFDLAGARATVSHLRSAAGANLNCDGSSDFYRYDLQTGAWEVLTQTPTPAPTGDGGALAWLDGYLYATRGYNTPTFWCYITDQLALRPRVVDQVGNVGYGQERFITLQIPALGNVAENVTAGDVITTYYPTIQGTAVAQAGVDYVALTWFRAGTTQGFTELTGPSGAPTRYRWAYQVQQLRDWGDGAYRLQVGVRDRNYQEWSTSMPVTVDTTPPTVAFSSLTDGSVITATGRITITGTASDATSGLARIRLSLDNTAAWREVAPVGNAWQATWDVPTLDGQPRRFVVETTDRAGWTTRRAITVTVDNVLPSGARDVTFNPPVGYHIQTGSLLQVTWSAPSDGSGVVRTFAALDQITNTLPTQAVSGTSFQATFNQFGRYYFHLRLQDANGNQRVMHYGPWYAWHLGSPPQPQYTYVIDGFIDLEHKEWLPEWELLGRDDRSGRTQYLFFAWDLDDVFLGWRGAHLGVDGDLVWFFDTRPGGSKEWAEEQGSRGAGEQSGPPCASAPLHTCTSTPLLPFEADFRFTVRHDGTFGLARWDGAGWVEATTPDIQAAHGPSGDVEVRIPRSRLEATGAVKMLALAWQPDNGSVWAVLPNTNPLLPLTPPPAGGPGGGAVDQRLCVGEMGVPRRNCGRCGVPLPDLPVARRRSA